MIAKERDKINLKNALERYGSMGGIKEHCMDCKASHCSGPWAACALWKIGFSNLRGDKK